MGSSVVPSDLTLSDLERSKSKVIYILSFGSSVSYTHICQQLITTLMDVTKESLLACVFPAVATVLLSPASSDAQVRLYICLCVCLLTRCLKRYFSNKLDFLSEPSL